MDITRQEYRKIQPRACFACWTNMYAMYPTGNINNLEHNTSEYLNIQINLIKISFHFLFKWTYRTANSWGTEDGVSCVGCGPQEHFRACADISIVGDGNPQPTTTVIPVPTTTENVPATTADSSTDAPCTNGGTRTYKRVCCKFFQSINIL